eukprot:gene1751-520_t
MPPFVVGQEVEESIENQIFVAPRVVFKRNLGEYMEKVLELDYKLFFPIYWGTTGFERTLDEEYMSQF